MEMVCPHGCHLSCMELRPACCSVNSLTWVVAEIELVVSKRVVLNYLGLWGTSTFLMPVDDIKLLCSLISAGRGSFPDLLGAGVICIRCVRTPSLNFGSIGAFEGYLEAFAIIPT